MNASLEELENIKREIKNNAEKIDNKSFEKILQKKYGIIHQLHSQSTRALLEKFEKELLWGSNDNMFEESEGKSLYNSCLSDLNDDLKKVANQK